jgi:hypothetical protein
MHLNRCKFISGIYFQLLLLLLFPYIYYKAYIRHKYKIIKLLLSQMKPQTVRIVKKEPLEALKEAGYSDRENSVVRY